MLAGLSDDMAVLGTPGIAALPTRLRPAIGVTRSKSNVLACASNFFSYRGRASKITALAPAVYRLTASKVKRIQP
jgi:hypothetical protein